MLRSIRSPAVIGYPITSCDRVLYASKGFPADFSNDLPPCPLTRCAGGQASFCWWTAPDTLRVPDGLPTSKTGLPTGFATAGGHVPPTPWPAPVDMWTNTAGRCPRVCPHAHRLRPPPPTKKFPEQPGAAEALPTGRPWRVPACRTARKGRRPGDRGAARTTPRSAIGAGRRPGGERAQSATPFV